jgi:hypothetical protein
VDGLSLTGAAERVEALWAAVYPLAPVARVWAVSSLIALSAIAGAVIGVAVRAPCRWRRARGGE